MNELLEILSYKRGYGTESEVEFINKWLIPRLAPFRPKIDTVGNLIVQMKETEVLWSCHTDTVHTKAGSQTPVIVNDLITLPNGKPGDCLGADDGSGVWLMLQMLRRGTPGLYIFHRGEEKGCIGSQHIAKEIPEVLEGIKYAIAFDRKGSDNLITHQMGKRCASEEFSTSLSALLKPLGYTSDPTGVYTDTYEYSSIIPECTNLSVGYLSQHGIKETQSISQLKALDKALIDFDEKSLVAARDPHVTEFEDHGYSGGGGLDWAYPSTKPPKKDYLGVDPYMVELIADYPEIVAELLLEMNVDYFELQTEIIQREAA